jgi:hypothetical protein
MISKSATEPVVRAAKKASKGGRSEFASLKLNGTDYCIGDCVAVKLFDDSEAYGTILKIYQSKADGYAYVTLRWFYTPSDVFSSSHDFLSEAELFDSDHVQDIWVQAIFMKVDVMSLEDYHSCDEVEHNVYFCRSTYKSREATLVPPFSEWKRTCVCNKILNPDHFFIVCEGCGAMYHEGCISASFKCTGCSRSNLLT